MLLFCWTNYPNAPDKWTLAIVIWSLNFSIQITIVLSRTFPRKLQKILPKLPNSLKRYGNVILKILNYQACGFFQIPDPPTKRRTKIRKETVKEIAEHSVEELKRRKDARRRTTGKWQIVVYLPRVVQHETSRTRFDPRGSGRIHAVKRGTYYVYTVSSGYLVVHTKVYRLAVESVGINRVDVECNGQRKLARSSRTARGIMSRALT